MRSAQQFNITLPIEMARTIEAKVSSGEYASESEVIRDALRAMRARDKAVENWLREEVAPAYEAMKADPSRGRSASDVRATFAADYESASKAR
jgi:putative addiction module CopG family antidote